MTTPSSGPGSLVLCPPQCPTSCTTKHHPLLVVLLNCEDTDDKNVMMHRLYQLQHVVLTYKEDKKWNLDAPIPDGVDTYRYPAVHWACALGRVVALLWLLEHGANPCNTNAPDGQTGLHCAVHQLRSVYPREAGEKLKKVVWQMPTVLLIKDRHGNTPLHVCGNKLFNKAPKEDFYVECLWTMVDMLKQQKNETLTASLAMQNDEGNTVIHLLCQDKFLPLIKEIFACTDANFDVTNNQGQTLMHLAQASGAMKVASFLTKQQKGAEKVAPGSPLAGTGEASEPRSRSGSASSSSSHGSTAPTSPSCKRPSSSKYAIGRASPTTKEGGSSPAVRKRRSSSHSEGVPPKKQPTVGMQKPVIAKLPAETTTQCVEASPQSPRVATESENVEEILADSKVSLPPDYFRQGAEFMKYLADCSDDKKVKLLEIVKQDENTYAKKMKEASDSKAEIDAKMNKLKEDQQNTVLQIQRLLDHVSELQREETGLKDDIGRLQHLKNSALCNMRQLKEKLSHCQGALAVLETL